MLSFAVAIVKLADRMPRTYAGRHVAGQMLRAGTSAGANYEEACAAQSRKDFIHKMQIVLKELKETLFWLRLIVGAGMLPEPQVRPVLQEAEELSKIIAQSVITAKSRR